MAKFGDNAVIETKRYRTFSEFYPFYLSEHVNRTSRRLHFIGTTTALILVVSAFITQMWGLLQLLLSKVTPSHGLDISSLNTITPPLSHIPGLAFLATGACGGKC